MTFVFAWSFHAFLVSALLFFVFVVAILACRVCEEGQNCASGRLRLAHAPELEPLCEACKQGCDCWNDMSVPGSPCDKTRAPTQELAIRVSLVALSSSQRSVWCS